MIKKYSDCRKNRIVLSYNAARFKYTLLLMENLIAILQPFHLHNLHF